MLTLLILAAIGAFAGGVGGALTNGLDGLVLGGSAGLVLGVVAWVTENMIEQRVQELNPEQLINELNRTNAPLYEPPVRHQQYGERGRSL